MELARADTEFCKGWAAYFKIILVMEQGMQHLCPIEKMSVQTMYPIVGPALNKTVGLYFVELASCLPHKLTFVFLFQIT